MTRVLLAFVALLTVASPSLAIAPEQKPVDARTVTRGFFRTVFGLEYGGVHADAHKVKRYAGAVRFHVTDLSGANRGPAARDFLRALPHRIQHLRAGLVATAADANFRVILVKDTEFGAVVSRELKADAIAMGARCLVGVSTVDGRIERSTAIIVADDDFLFHRCLVEEVLQGLGPMNDDPRLTQSVFNDQSRHATLTPHDEAILNVLYHPLILPGMTGTEAHGALPAVLDALGYRR